MGDELNSFILKLLRKHADKTDAASRAILRDVSEPLAQPAWDGTSVLRRGAILTSINVEPEDRHGGAWSSLEVDTRDKLLDSVGSWSRKAKSTQEVLIPAR